MERAIRQFDEIKYQKLRQGAGNKSDCRIIYYKARWLWRALQVRTVLHHQAGSQSDCNEKIRYRHKSYEEYPCE